MLKEKQLPDTALSGVGVPLHPELKSSIKKQALDKDK